MVKLGFAEKKISITRAENPNGDYSINLRRLLAPFGDIFQFTRLHLWDALLYFTLDSIEWHSGRDHLWV